MGTELIGHASRREFSEVGTCAEYWLKDMLDDRLGERYMVVGTGGIDQNYSLDSFAHVRDLTSNYVREHSSERPACN